MLKCDTLAARKKIEGTPSLAQQRTIEKRGILILDAEEQEAHFLRVIVSVRQLPRLHSQNGEWPRVKSCYGRFCLLQNGYVVADGLIYYQNQIIYEENRNIDATTEFLGCLLESQLSWNTFITPLISSSASWSYSVGKFNFFRIRIDAIVFSLPDGCVIDVSLQDIPMERCGEPISEFFANDPPTPPGEPLEAPPIGAPPNTGVPGSGRALEITPPYDANNNDNGDTYVPPDTSNYPPSDYGLNWQVEARIKIWRGDPSLPQNYLLDIDSIAVGNGRIVNIRLVQNASGTKYFVDARPESGGAIQSFQFQASSGASDVEASISNIRVTLL